MNNLIDKALKKIVSDEELLEKLLLIDNIDSLYEFFISQEDGYSKTDLVKYFVRIAKDNVISEEDLEKVSGGAINKNFSKVLCASLAALTLTSVPVSTSSVSAYTSLSSESTQSDSQSPTSIKDKFAQKVQQIKKAIKEHPVASSAATSVLTFYGLYKAVIDPQLKDLRNKDRELGLRIASVEYLREMLENYRDEARQTTANVRNIREEYRHLSLESQRAMTRLDHLSADIQNYIRELRSADANILRANNNITARLDNLVRDITNLQGRIRQSGERNVQVSIQNINRQIQNILQVMDENNIDVSELIQPDYSSALELRTQQRCELSPINGSTYLRNYITNLEVNTRDTASIRDQLRELCTQFNYNRGIEFDDRNRGWEQNATEFFFTRIGRYSELSQYHKTIFAQCIKAMYQNKDNPVWHGIIDATLMSLSSHGAHCSWRAEALVNTAYDNLCQFLRDNRIGAEAQNAEGENQIQALMDKAFTNLKDKMIQTAQQMFLQDHAHDREPLLDCNYMISHLKFLLGMTNTGEEDGERAATRYFQRVTDKKYLIKESDEIMSHSLEEASRRTLLGDIEQENLSFDNYCKFSGKSHEEIQSLINAIENYPNGEFKNLLRQWVQGNTQLNLGSEQGTIDGVVTPIRRNVRRSSLTALEGEGGRYRYTDNDGNEHICTIVRNVGTNAQVEYVNEFNHGSVQRNIFSMLEILSLKAQREHNLRENDGSLIGCPELNHLNGFKFIIACFNRGYFQEIG